MRAYFNNDNEYPELIIAPQDTDDEANIKFFQKTKQRTSAIISVVDGNIVVKFDQHLTKKVLLSKFGFVETEIEVSPYSKVINDNTYMLFGDGLFTLKLIGEINTTIGTAQTKSELSALLATL